MNFLSLQLSCTGFWTLKGGEGNILFVSKNILRCGVTVINQKSAKNFSTRN